MARAASKLVYGAVAGAIGTFAMTAAMRRLKKRLPPDEQYPLPPREVSEIMLRRQGVDAGESELRAAAMLSHFGYGALSGALYATLRRRSPQRGALFGALVWAGSYFGWIPAAAILTSADHHPARRNLLMILAHLVWGAATDLAYQELRKADAAVFGGGPAKDDWRRRRRMR